MHTVNDRRRHKPSYTIPFVFEALEVVMIWIVFGIVESTFDVTQWSWISWGLALAWFAYTAYKLKRVLNRQENYKW